MAQILKSRRLVNPGRKRRSNSGSGKRRMTLKQKLHFGSARQRAAAKEALKGKRRNPGTRSKVRVTRRKRIHRTATRRRRNVNVGEIITIKPLERISNSGTTKRRKKGKITKSNMARRKRRSSSGTHRRRRANPGAPRRRRRVAVAGPVHHRRRVRRRRSNPTMVRTVYRNRGTRRRSVRRHRNPGMVSGDFGRAISIVGGAIVTKFVTDMLPASINSGIPGYIATAVVAVLQGKAIGKILKNPVLGKDMTTGGFVYLSLRVAQDFLPSFNLPFGLKGMGLVGPSSFYVPQVPINGNMGTYMLPPAVSGAIAAGGMQGVRRGGRTR